MNPDLAAKIEEFIAKLQECLKCTSPFTIVSLCIIIIIHQYACIILVG